MSIITEKISNKKENKNKKDDGFISHGSAGGSHCFDWDDECPYYSEDLCE